MERNDLKIPIEKLHYVCDLKDFDFKDTSEVAPLRNFVGQREAVRSLRFGLEIESTGYNIMVIGDHGSGRTSLVHRELDRLIEKSTKHKKLNLKDICYIYNFDDPDRPKVLIFDAKEGRKFQKRIKSLVKILSKRIEIVLEGKEYREAAEKIVERFQQKLKPPLDVLKKQAKENNLLLEEGEKGDISILPMSLKNENKVMSDEEFKSLSKDIKENLKKEQSRLATLKRVTSSIVNELEEKTEKLIDDLEIKLIEREIEKIFSRFKYTDLEVINYLNNLKEYALENIDLFQPKSKEHNTIMLGGMQVQLNGSNGGDDFLPFRVNLLVDNSKVDRPPVIFEEYPTLSNLFGRIDKKMDKMTYYTDQTLINPGSFLLANGGYLVIKAVDLITNPGVWKKLKQTLESGFLKIEDPLESFGYFSSISLNPDSIPIEVKVIVISDLEIYHLLANYEKNFLADAFKVKVEFDTQMNSNPKTFHSYAAFISFYCHQENLLPFSKEAVAKMIECGIKLTDDQKKLSTRFGLIKDLIEEANFWTQKSKNKIVKAKDVVKAVNKKRQRAALSEKRVHEYLKRGIPLIDVKGERVGQINALVVYGSGDFSFGRPSRVTAQTFLGRKDIVSIQRKVKLTGPIFDTGIDILSGYLGGQYGQDKLLALSASLSFEQSYGMIDGDSATVAETLALLSSLAKLPLKQSLAVTGSMNQFGDVQPVGGVNQKIEGFFDLCRDRRLNGEQGVLIPKQNIDNLMLKPKVVEAVTQEKFHIYAFNHIDEAIELMFGCSAQKVHDLINNHFTKMNKILKESLKKDSKK